ncbi:MAG TPA: cupin domain-containing protein, partial [Methylophilaceae bacterium]|nr:cupin domain-containing protein [Methylophilaceae bacterium]
DVQARLVINRQGKWQVENGPFDEARFAKLPKRDWTLLVQGVNHHLPEAAALLQRFDFIPYARLDDLMVSYAPDGGGVGPHFDSYDVFLLQGQGKRLWRVSEQDDLTLVDGAPLRILKNFKTEQEYLLEAGDMLYLPPHVAHWGIAVGDCITYSIGFRAPSAQELATQFLTYMQENLSLEGMYADSDLKPSSHPAKISAEMIGRVVDMLKKIRWDKQDVANFLGSYLSEPKNNVLFDPPAKMDSGDFLKHLRNSGIALDLKSQALFHGKQFFINGEQITMQAGHADALKLLADQRWLAASCFADSKPDDKNFADASLVNILYQWYQDGYLQFPHTGG